MTSTSFVENQGDGVIHLEGSQLSLEAVTMVRNSGSSTGGLVLVSSEVKATQCSFSELLSQQGCVLSVLRASNATFESCFFRDIECIGSIMHLPLDSSLRLTHCLLERLTSNTNIISIQEGRTFQAFSLTASQLPPFFHPRRLM